ncbi:MAG: radical SAM/SPASM domain-containing protein [Desulfobulbaceae bacterium]|nr:MAG: radical SAM/SPASM domain-containing protein [Desulfobulbaceae bacterium]
MNEIKGFTEHWSGYKNGLLRLEHGPAALYIESVHGCPGSCAMCHYSGTRAKNINHDILAHLEPYFNDLEVMGIHGQGEPLLGQLQYFINQANSNRCVLHMNSAGFHLTPQVADSLAQTRLSIRFSIHAGRKETYRRIMGQDLDKTKRKIAYLVDRLKKTGGSHDLWFSYIVMKENLEEIKDFLHLAHSCGIRSVRFMRLFPNWQTIKGKNYKNRDFTFNYFEQSNRRVIEKFQSNADDYHELAARLGIKIEYGSVYFQPSMIDSMKEALNSLIVPTIHTGLFPLLKNRGTCLIPWFGGLVINQKGQVRLCCSSSTVVGKLKETSLAEIWNSNRMMRIRQDFANGYIPKVCGFCQGVGLDNFPNNSFTGLRQALPKIGD